MTRLRMVIASALLALAALVTPAAAAISDTTQAQDVGWGLASTDGETQPEPDEAAPTPSEYPAGDVGWG
ncbi:hypothetical protein [Streptomyces rochei]|uniref:hypothetical protein n=1 Tax=Streptomyces rochei TaxID=1928 RepID=UPI0013BAE608|nr:hypothetical protein [Streptomyces rochei]NEC76503.1 hypothetical protein [Streptomyces rochei]